MGHITRQNDTVVFRITIYLDMQQTMSASVNRVATTCHHLFITLPELLFSFATFLATPKSALLKEKFRAYFGATLKPIHSDK